MPDYKTMYFRLFTATTEIVKVLCEAVKEAEEIYFESSLKEEESVEKSIIKNNKKDHQ